MALQESIKRALTLLSNGLLQPEQASELSAMEAEEPGMLEAAASELFERKREALKAIVDDESQCRKVAREIENRYGIDEDDINPKAWGTW